MSDSGLRTTNSPILPFLFHSSQEAVRILYFSLVHKFLSPLLELNINVFQKT